MALMNAQGILAALTIYGVMIPPDEKLFAYSGNAFKLVDNQDNHPFYG